MSSPRVALTAAPAALLTLMLNLLPLYFWIAVSRALFHVGYQASLCLDLRIAHQQGRESFITALVSIAMEPVLTTVIYVYSCSLFTGAAAIAHRRAGDLLDIARAIRQKAESSLDPPTQNLEAKPTVLPPRSNRITLPEIPAWTSEVHQEDRDNSQNDEMSFEAIYLELELMETELRLMSLLRSTEDLIDALEATE